MPNKTAKHWIVLVMCCMLACASIGISLNTSGVFYTPVSEDLGILRGDFALHATIFSVVTAFTMLIVPTILRIWGFKFILVIATALGAGSTALMGLCSSTWMFYILSAIRGFSTGMFSSVTLTIILNNWFEEKIGIATSIVFSMSGVGGALVSPLLTAIINATNWRVAFFVQGALIAALCIPVILYPFHIKPQKDGLLPYGYVQKEGEVTVNSSNYDFNFANPVFIIFFTFALIYCMITSFAQHLPGYATSIGFSAALGSLMVTSVMLGNIGSKLVIGAITEKIGSLWSTLLMIVINGLATLVILVATSETIMIGASFMFGTCFSVGAVGLSLLTKRFFGQKNFNNIYSKISFAANIGTALALTIIGYIYDFFGSYFYAFVMVFAIVILSVVMVLYCEKATKATRENA
ncbi:MAG: MFS transporter [Erysipelotrichaceae bacterium]|nr:MFS transporter [Erysipelotrichaceae bacterium]